MHKQHLWVFGLFFLLILPGLVGCKKDEAIPLEIREVGRLQTSTTIKGRDGGYSGMFGGRSIWLYGDTVLSLEGIDGSSWRHNSWSWTTQMQAKGGITGFQERNDSRGAPTEFFPLTTAEDNFNKAHAGDNCKEKPCGARYALWPGSLVEDKARKRAFIFYTKIYGERGEWNFRSVGHSVAQWDDFSKSPTRPVVRPSHEFPTLLFDPSQPNFGSAAFVHEQWIYAYGCEKTGLSKPCHLARVPLENPFKREAWEYYKGNQEWSSKIDDATALFEGAPMLTIHYNAYLSEYIAVYSKPLSPKIVLRRSKKPEGPWSEEQVIFTTQASHDGAVAYSALGHAEYAQDNGRIEYITYYRSPAPWQGEIRLLELTFSPKASQ